MLSGISMEVKCSFPKLRHEHGPTKHTKHTHTHTYMHAHTHTYTCARMHTHTHTHTNSLSLSPPHSLSVQHNSQYNLFLRLQSGLVRKFWRPSDKTIFLLFLAFSLQLQTVHSTCMYAALCVRYEGLDSQQSQMCSSCRTHRRWRKTQRLEAKSVDFCFLSGKKFWMLVTGKAWNVCL